MAASANPNRKPRVGSRPFRRAATMSRSNLICPRIPLSQLSSTSSCVRPRCFVIDSSRRERDLRAFANETSSPIFPSNSSDPMFGHMLTSPLDIGLLPRAQTRNDRRVSKQGTVKSRMRLSNAFEMFTAARLLRPTVGRVRARRSPPGRFSHARQFAAGAPSDARIVAACGSYVMDRLRKLLIGGSCPTPARRAFSSHDDDVVAGVEQCLIDLLHLDAAQVDAWSEPLRIGRPHHRRSRRHDDISVIHTRVSVAMLRCRQRAIVGARRPRTLSGVPRAGLYTGMLRRKARTVSTWRAL
jgi:hypothetical protein